MASYPFYLADSEGKYNVSGTGPAPKKSHSGLGSALGTNRRSQYMPESYGRDVATPRRPESSPGQRSAPFLPPVKHQGLIII